jgi:hypothetical protein
MQKKAYRPFFRPARWQKLYYSYFFLRSSRFQSMEVRQKIAVSLFHLRQKIPGATSAAEYGGAA